MVNPKLFVHISRLGATHQRWKAPGTGEFSFEGDRAKVGRVVLQMVSGPKRKIQQSRWATLKAFGSLKKKLIGQKTIQYRGSTYGMQNTMELWHLCLIVATHETSIAMRKASLNFAPAAEIAAQQLKLFCVLSRHTFLENYNIFRAQAIIPKFTTVVPLPCHEIWIGNLNATLSNIAPGTETGSCSFALFFLTLLVFDPTSLLLYYSFALLLFCSAFFLTPKSLFFTTRFSYVGNFSTNFVFFRSSKVNSGTALEALGWRLFFFPPGGPGPDDLSLQTAVDDMRTVQKTDCT